MLEFHDNYQNGQLGESNGLLTSFILFLLAHWLNQKAPINILIGSAAIFFMGKIFN